MSVCAKVRGKRRTLCLGDLDKEIHLADRSITAPQFGSVDFLETFVNQTEATWAMVETTQGSIFFSGVSTDTEKPITHKWYIEFDEVVTAEYWVLFEGKYYDILRVEDLEERHEFQRLYCRERGLITKLASHA